MNTQTPAYSSSFQTRNGVSIGVLTPAPTLAGNGASAFLQARAAKEWAEAMATASGLKITAVEGGGFELDYRGRSFLDLRASTRDLRRNAFTMLHTLHVVEYAAWLAMADLVTAVWMRCDVRPGLAAEA